MTDVAAVADSAPVSPAGAPINDDAPAFNSPLGSQIPPDAVAKPESPKPASTLDDSIDRAMAKSAAKQAEPKAEPAKVEAKPAKSEQPRENGKFTAREPVAEPGKVADAVKPADTAQSGAEESPAWLKAHERETWTKAAPEMRAIAERRNTEAMQGIEKYRGEAERHRAIAEPVLEFHEMAQRSGTDLKTALTRYTNLEKVLRQNPIRGLQEVCDNIGLSLREVAAHVMGQSPDQQASQSDATIRELKQELSALKQQVGGVTQTISQQREQEIMRTVSDFAKDHPRVDELADDIEFFIKSGRAKDLAQAYELAERLNPGSAAAPNAAAPSPGTATPDLIAQPDKGQKSITGAPSTGLSSPVGKKRVALSLDDSLDRAFSRAG